MKKIIICLSIFCNLALLHAFEPIEHITQKRQELVTLQHAATLLEQIKDSPAVFDLLIQPSAMSMLFALHTTIAGLSKQQSPTIDTIKNELTEKIKLLEQCINTENNKPKAKSIPQSNTLHAKFGFGELPQRTRPLKKSQGRIRKSSGTLVTSGSVAIRTSRGQQYQVTE